MRRHSELAATQTRRRPAAGALEERVTGHQEGSRGLIRPSRRLFSTAPAGGLIPLVPTRDIGVHISSAVSSLSLRAKDHLEGTKVEVSPRYCAPQKVQTGSAAAGGHRRVATRKTTGDLATRRGAATQREELSGQRRYATATSGLHRSWWTLVYARSGNRLHSVQPFLSPRALRGASSMASCLSVDAQTRRFDPTRSLFRKFTWSAESSISPAHPCPHGLRASLRHPVSPGQRRVCSGHGDCVTTSRFPATAFV